MTTIVNRLGDTSSPYHLGLGDEDGRAAGRCGDAAGRRGRPLESLEGRAPLGEERTVGRDEQKFAGQLVPILQRLADSLETIVMRVLLYKDAGQKAPEQPECAGMEIKETDRVQRTERRCAGRRLDVGVDAQGKTSVVTKDGYTVCCEGKDQAWTISDPEGKTTRIWGDPHVVESDGDKWDFHQRSSFLFGDNKITVETAPRGDGTAYTGTITIYSGAERVTIKDIDKDKPSIVAAAGDGRIHDVQLDDGEVYTLAAEAGGNDDEWRRAESRETAGRGTPAVRSADATSRAGAGPRWEETAEGGGRRRRKWNENEEQ